jgi:hypothetical protein
MIIEKLESEGLELGIYGTDMNKLSLKAMEPVLEAIEFGDTTDIGVKVRRELYVVEVCRVDNELDFKIMSRGSYKNRYGRDFFEDED